MLNILEEHELDGYIYTVVEDPTSDVGCINFNRNQYKSKWIIYDSVKDNSIFVITLLKNAKEHFDTLTNLYENKSSRQNREL